MDIIELDTRYVTKIRSVDYDPETQTIRSIDERFYYDENIANNTKKTETQRQKVSQKKSLELHPDSLVYVTSGLVDPKTGYAISWLHKAVKPANQLRLLENALIIYRITRAPERRIFNVDTNNMPPGKAAQHLNKVQRDYRNRMSFDPEMGTFKDSRHYQTMQEDFWFAKTSGGRGTEITTLPGGQNLDDIADVLYFQKQLYKALNIPVSRLETDSMVALGRQAEISRDELKFSRFVSKIRKRFNLMFMDLLKTELILTKVITAKEWRDIEQFIEFDYALDMYIEEMRNSELLRDRIDLVGQMQPYVGRYVSHEYVRKNILKQSEEDMKEEDEKIKAEKDDQTLNPPEPEDGGAFRRF